MRERILSRFQVFAKKGKEDTTDDQDTDDDNDDHSGKVSNIFAHRFDLCHDPMMMFPR